MCGPYACLRVPCAYLTVWILLCVELRAPPAVWHGDRQTRGGLYQGGNQHTSCCRLAQQDRQPICGRCTWRAGPDRRDGGRHQRRNQSQDHAHQHELVNWATGGAESNNGGGRGLQADGHEGGVEELRRDELRQLWLEEEGNCRSGGTSADDGGFDEAQFASLCEEYS
jgi:hypothetical protein